MDVVKIALDAHAGGPDKELPDNTRLRVCFGPNMVVDGWPSFGNDAGSYSIHTRRYSDIERRDVDSYIWFDGSRVLWAEAYQG